MSGGEISVDDVRACTPGIDHVNHLSSAGASLMPEQVLDAMAEHHVLESRIGGYEAHALRSDDLNSVYGSVARLVNARPEEIALVENATVAWCQAFYALDFAPGDRVLTCEAEYGANYVAFLQRAARQGIVIDVIPSDASGALDLDAMQALLDDRVKLVAVTWIPTNGGLVNPAAGVGAIARSQGIPFLLDAAQAVGQMPVDVDEIGCDFLSATGRKFLRGPRGTGFLYVRESMLDGLEPAMVDHFSARWVATDRYQLRGDARRFETWENSYALRAGLGAAVDYALDLGVDAIQKRSWGLAAYLRTRLAELQGVTLRDLGNENCAIVSLTLDGHAPERVVEQLRDQAINIGASDPAFSTRLDAQARNLPTLLRISPHYFNTHNEIDALIDALGRLRTMNR